jgi:glycosyltransferase involved in cell wall biosynthesis
LPIIVTANAGAEDLVVEGITGFLVPIRDPEELAQKISWCGSHRVEVAEMGRAARSLAMLYTWDRYTDKVVSVLEEVQGTAQFVNAGFAEAVVN